MTTQLIEALQTSTPTTFSMLHLRDPDSAGHASGFMSPEYLAAVQAADTQLGRLLDAIAADSYLAQSTVVVLTSDHGGMAATQTHGNPTQPENYTIPFLVWGFEIASGADLYALNLDDRTDPLVIRPAYDDLVPQPVRNAEAGNLATDLLGLPAVPSSRIGAGQDLDVSERHDAVHRPGAGPRPAVCPGKRAGAGCEAGRGDLDRGAPARRPQPRDAA